jgi:hypothetical protein
LGVSKISPVEFKITIAAPSTSGGSLNVIEIDSWDAFTISSALGELLTKSVWADAEEMGPNAPTPANRTEPIMRFDLDIPLGYASGKWESNRFLGL